MSWRYRLMWNIHDWIITASMVLGEWMAEIAELHLERRKELMINELKRIAIVAENSSKS